MKHPKKKKRPVSKPVSTAKKGSSLSQNPKSDPVDQNPPKVLTSLVEGIANFSIDDSETNSSTSLSRDEEDAIEIFGSLTETGSSSGSSGSGSGNGSSSSSSGVAEMEAFSRKGGKRGKVVAATGMVSSMLGKDYVPTSSRKGGVGKVKGLGGGGEVSHEEAEQFLCSMLSEDCELGMDLVKDVLCQCGYDVEKALDTLLELTAPLSELSQNGQHQNVNANSGDTSSYQESNDSLTDGTSDFASSSDSDLNMGFNTRNYYDVLAGTGTGIGTGTEPPSGPKTTSELTQDVLESLFNTRKNKSSKHEPSNMNWRNVVKKMESFGQALNYPSEDTVKNQPIPAKGQDYQVYRNTASQQWDSMKSYYHKAASAYANGNREYAAYLSDQGRMCNEKARRADERASHDIFNSRNKEFENIITIDLHGQHVKQGMKLLKLHLLFGAYVRSVRLFRVITGCGSHGVGKSKLKQSVVNLLESENIEWKEENRGTLLITLNGEREFSFLDSGSDTSQSVGAVHLCWLS